MIWYDGVVGGASRSKEKASKLDLPCVFSCAYREIDPRPRRVPWSRAVQQLTFVVRSLSSTGCTELKRFPHFHVVTCTHDVWWEVSFGEKEAECS